MPFRLRTAGIVLALLFALGALVDGAEARGLTPWDVAKIRSVGTASIAPDGSSVAYTLIVPRTPMVDDNGADWVELHVYDVKSGSSRPFVTGSVNVSAVKWTPDGSHIAFLAKRGGDEKTALYVIPVAGGEARRLVKHTEDIAGYDFNDAGTRVVFLAKPGKTDREKELEKQGFDMEFYEENVKNNALHVADVDLRDHRGSGEVETRVVELEGHPANVAYRPGHEHVLVSLAADSRIDLEYMFRQYVVVDLATGAIAARIETEGKLGDAAWSPDGQHVALIGSADIHDPKEGRLLVAPATGGAPRELLPDFMGHVEGIAWSDARTVVYLADVNVHTELGSIGLNGGKPKLLIGQGQPVIAGFDLSADGKQLVVTGDSPEYPRELFVGRTGRTPSRVTDSNPWLADITLGAQNVHTWNARDGLELEGILITPLDYQHGKRYPLIVSVHGGPEAHERNGWKTAYSRPGQFMAAQGYFVWYPNYRGSTGRGVAFTLTSQGDPGGAEFDDIVDGIDDLIAMGLVDGEKVGITGGSYGGYASAWGATRHSDRYAAAVMFVGISEQYSKFGTTDIPRESQLVHQNPRKVYTDWQFFLERSPIYHAEGSKTPLLILHGKDDPRVHPTQSMTMYRYFEHMADAPVRLVWYPGEGHGNRKAAGKLDYSLRLMRWMNHFILEGGTEKPPVEIDYEQMEEKELEAR
jgi:dipeptidyl aminopeptidase/acylaminoacyl peptidase